MKEYLPDVRFLSTAILPNTMLLKSADAVWIQPNCLSHADYDKIMSVVRESHVRVRYIEYDSPIKCAQQAGHGGFEGMIVSEYPYQNMIGLKSLMLMPQRYVPIL